MYRFKYIYIINLFLINMNFTLNSIKFRIPPTTSLSLTLIHFHFISSLTLMKIIKCYCLPHCTPFFPAHDPSAQTEAAEGESHNLANAEAGDTEIQTQAAEARTKSLGDKMREKSWFGKKCVKIFRVFSNTFAMTFLAEWGDR